jgi:hypothetical protein
MIKAEILKKNWLLNADITCKKTDVIEAPYLLAQRIQRVKIPYNCECNI